VTKDKVSLAYFTDVLCVWAYTAQIRMDELRNNFADKIDVNYHFIPIFGCTEKRIQQGWKDKGGYSGFSDHIKSVCSQFPHVKIHSNIWKINIPTTSANVHLFFKAIQLLEADQIISCDAQNCYHGKTLFEEVLWRTRIAFFEQAIDISKQSAQLKIAEELNLPINKIEIFLQNGQAMAALCRDIELKDLYKVEGSPSYILNEGRQKLYGNVGYKIIEANVVEILEKPQNQASWC